MLSVPRQRVQVMCKCDPPKVAIVKTSNSVNNTGRDYYKWVAGRMTRY